MSNKNLRDSFFLNSLKASEDFFGNQITSSGGEVTIRISVDHNNLKTFPKGFVNKEALDATTDFEIALHKKEDDEQALLDALNKNA